MIMSKYYGQDGSMPLHVDPSIIISQVFAFQRAIAQWGTARDPQDFLAVQRAIVKIAEQNMAVLAGLFQPPGETAVPPPPPADLGD